MSRFDHWCLGMRRAGRDSALKNRAHLTLEALEARDVPATLSVTDVTVQEGLVSLGALDPDGAATVGLDGPRGIAFNNLPGHLHYQDLFVTSYVNHSVLRFDWTSKTYHPFVLPDSGGLGESFGVAFGPDGHLYVTDLHQPVVLRYDGTDGHFLDTYVTAGLGGLDQASGIAFGGDGNLYVGSDNTGQILKYQGPGGEQPGQFMGIFATTGTGSTPREMTFGPDGNLYIACPQFDTPTPYDGIVKRYDGLSGQFIDDFVPTGRGGIITPRSPVFDSLGHLYIVDNDLKEVLRFQGPGEPNPGAFIDTYITTGQLGMTLPLGLALGADGNWYVGDRDADKVVQFAPGALAQFTVTLDSSGVNEVRVDYATTNGTAVAGSDFVQTSGTLIFEPGETSQTVIVTTLDDFVGEPTESFQLDLSNAVGATIADSQGIGTILDNETKFFVVDDATANQTFEYGSGGASVESYALNTANTAPRGAASNAAGDKVWVVDANKKVYVYNTSGGLLGSWTAGSLVSNATVEGITTNGTDIWIVDAKQDKVFRYTGAASRLSGSQNAASSFSLNNSNKDPKDIVTDGTSLWVVNDSTTNKVFKYTFAGSLLGSWTIDAANASPTGITLDPTNVNHLWIVDNGTDHVYQYDNAASRTSGSQSASTSFALAAGNTNPQGIADPPAGGAGLNPQPAKKRLARDNIDRLFADELSGSARKRGRRLLMDY